jgi:hypothetical protein
MASSLLTLKLNTMTPDPSGLTEIIQPASTLGPVTPFGLLLAALLYFKRISDKRETERDAQIGKQEKRIEGLEAQQEEARRREEKNTQEYKALAENMTSVVAQTRDVMDQTKGVMQQVLAKLEKEK